MIKKKKKKKPPEKKKPPGNRNKFHTLTDNILNKIVIKKYDRNKE